MSKEEEQPKIVSDEGWKEEAKREKEKLSEKPEKESGQEQVQGADQKAGGTEQLPPANFMGLVNMLVLQTLLYMGRLHDPEDKKAQSMVNLDLAKHYIDLLGVLEEKTKGNLTDEENQSLSLTMHEIRMQYVQLAT